MESFSEIVDKCQRNTAYHRNSITRLRALKYDLFPLLLQNCFLFFVWGHVVCLGGRALEGLLMCRMLSMLHTSEFELRVVGGVARNCVHFFLFRVQAAFGSAILLCDCCFL
jgi:hypothetical protein